MFTINNGGLIADTLSGNYPFRANGQKQKAWLSYSPANSTDTFAVSTSWFNPVTSASAYLITSTINNIAANTVLSWEAMSPDVNNSDGYEVYVTASTSTVPVVGDFSTMIYSISSEKNTWQKHGISLSAFVGQNIRIAFKNNSSNKYQLWVDDIVVENLSNGLDMACTSNDTYKYGVINTNHNIIATFKNYGYTPVTSLTINYQVGGGSITSELKNLSSSLNYLGSQQFTFSTPYISSSPAYNKLKIWATAINGSSDQATTNDTIIGNITLSSTVPNKKVLVEQFTGTNCGWCPDGYANLKTIANTDTNMIITSLHNNDNMTIAASAPLFTMYGNNNSAMIDRYLFSQNTPRAINQSNWSNYITQRESMIVPVSVKISGITYNATTKQLDATVSATFVGDVKGQYNLNLYIKENNVYGPIADSSDNQWNQHNGLYNIPSSSFYQYGNLIGSEYVMSAASYKHQSVVDEFLDGWMGDPTSIPTNSATIGQTYSKTYSYTLPNVIGNEFRYFADNIYLIGVVSEYDPSNNAISLLNAKEIKLTSNPEAIVGVKELAHTDMQLNVFPNPATDVCYLSYNLKENQYVKVSVYNTLGELVYIETQNMTAGDVKHSLNLNHLQAGNYSVQVSFKNNSISKKLTIIK
jgi:hypothetical protein